MQESSSESMVIYAIVLSANSQTKKIVIQEGHLCKEGIDTGPKRSPTARQRALLHALKYTPFSKHVASY